MIKFVADDMKNVFRTSILLFILFCFCKQSKGQDLILFEPDSTDYFINLNENDLLSKTTIDENNAYILRSISHDPSNTLAKHYLYLLRYNLDGSYVNKIPLGIQTMVVATYSYLSVLPNDSSLLVMFYNGFSSTTILSFVSITVFTSVLFSWIKQNSATTIHKILAVLKN